MSYVYTPLLCTVLPYDPGSLPPPPLPPTPNLYCSRVSPPKWQFTDSRTQIRIQKLSLLTGPDPGDIKRYDADPKHLLLPKVVFCQKRDTAFTSHLSFPVI